jgi:pimeloyl-ACP methyl ester carboxylesterase
MRSRLLELPVRHFAGSDGARLAYRELGHGTPVVLLHGFCSTAMVNWVRYGHAERIAAAGHRVIMPDLRGHGDSAKSHLSAAYPADVLASDALSMIDQLGLVEYDLGGYSLGARTTVRMLVRGATPSRAIVAGMGLAGIVNTTQGSGYFRRILTNPGMFKTGSPEWLVEAFLATVGSDRVALLHVLDASVDTPLEALGRIRLPTLVLAGDLDHDTGSAQQLADGLGRGRYQEVPGNHMSAVTKADLGVAIANFLEELP